MMIIIYDYHIFIVQVSEETFLFFQQNLTDFL
jgi:hypothetical protein